MIKAFIYKIRKKPFQYFIIKFIVFVAMVLILDITIGSILNYLYFKQKSGLLYRTTYSIEKTTANILIFGSSRANHHYDPDVFEKRLNLSYYNIGRDGNFIFYHTAVLKGVLKRYKPKVVILDLNGGEFQQNQVSYDRLSSLLPYYRRHPEMRSTIEIKSKLEKFKMCSDIYPFNSVIFTILVGNADFNKKRKVDLKGYVPLTNIWKGPIKVENIYSNYEIDSTKIRAYETFIQDCILAKVKLYVVTSPYYKKTNRQDYSVTIGQEIAKRNHVRFFDFSRDTNFTNHPKLFSDIIHLNESGAKVFSNMLIDSLNKTKIQ